MIPHEPAYAFEEESVLAYAPQRMGVYVIFKGNKWIYIGHGDIQARLIGHVHGDIPDIQSEGPSWFMFELYSSEDAAIAREKILVLSFRPLCNRNAPVGAR